jgi:hypothetical protein
MSLTTRSELIQAALGEAATDCDPTTVAKATVSALNLLFAELKPLIGMLALRALHARSLHLANASFERPGADLATPDELLGHLHRDLASREPGQALSAAQALLLALANLLVSLIGEPLTNRMLQKAWGNSPLARSSELKPP